MEELIVNEFNERWVKVDDDNFIKNVDYHIDTCFGRTKVNRTAHSFRIG